jgi:transposase
MYCRLKDFRRVATRYDKLARNYQSAITLAAAIPSGYERVWTLASFGI